MHLSRQQLIEAAMCCRCGAIQARKDAETQTSLAVKRIHLTTAEYRDELARLFDEEAKRRQTV